MRIACLLIVVAATGVAHADALPPGVRDELAAIGAKVVAKPPVLQALCARPAKADLAALEQRVLAWIDQQTPDEKSVDPSTAADPDLVFTACNVTGGVAVDVSLDRVPRKGGSSGTRRNFVLRVAGDRIEVIAARQSTPRSDWMEWADEGRLRFLAEVDVDGDGAADLVWSDFEHEGGGVSSYDHLRVRLATGQERSIAQVKNLGDNRIVAGQLVVAGQLRADQRLVYACIGKDLRVAPCAASAPLQRIADRIDIATQLATLTEAPDRGQVVEWLAALGVKPPVGLLGALPATAPQQAAERHVAAFLTGKQLDDAFHEIFDQPHSEAVAFFDQLAAQLGDTRCTPTPLGDPVRAQLTGWIAQQDNAAEDIAIAPECGPYAWAEWSHRGDVDRNEVLFAVDGPAPVKVARFKQPLPDGPGPIDHTYDRMFFQHGDTTVGVVIRNQNLSVIANARVVAQSHGEIIRYAFRRGWRELSPDLVVDSGTLFHPSPTGLDRLDRALVQDHEAHRRALDRVLAGPPSKDPAYLAALRTLGAPASLIAECKKL